MHQTNHMGDPTHEGRLAFRAHGVTGQAKHSYPKDSGERMQFVSGFSEERNRAAERALNESHAYHDLTVREAPRDRAWAERLAAERGIQ
jgi:hypothetical protein